VASCAAAANDEATFPDDDDDDDDDDDGEDDEEQEEEEDDGDSGGGGGDDDEPGCAGDSFRAVGGAALRGEAIRVGLPLPARAPRDVPAVADGSSFTSAFSSSPTAPPPASSRSEFSPAQHSAQRYSTSPCPSSARCDCLRRLNSAQVWCTQRSQQSHCTHGSATSSSQRMRIRSRLRSSVTDPCPLVTSGAGTTAGSEL